MKLTREQSRRLLQERGIWITEACDRCGQLLGSVRWTRKGEPGSGTRNRRDGVNVSTPKLAATAQLAFVRREPIGALPAGRPKKHANNAEKCRSYRQSRKNVLVTRNTPSQQIENAQLADAKNGFHVVGPLPGAPALESGLMEESL
jgi:ssDNA-binding Zn-finger/Zn-ribbon topoisomerase 1